MANNGQAFKPAKMAQTTWDHLLKFATFHDAWSIIMYHNFPLVLNIQMFLAVLELLQSQELSRSTINY